MLDDIQSFLRACHQMFHYVRGVILFQVLLLAICAVVFVVAEGIPVGDSVYLTLITATTIGYGDIAPITTAGRAASVAAGFVGLVNFGLVTAITNRALRNLAETKIGREKAPPSS